MTPEHDTDRRSLLRQALHSVEDMRSKLEAISSEPVAIIGAGCRFPGRVNNLQDYWQLLSTGTNAVTAIPESRWNGRPVPPDASGWRAGLIEDYDKFDARLFGISAREATTLDPQHRMVMEVSWEAAENAGYAPTQLAGSETGVFIGISNFDYRTLVEERGQLQDIYSATGNAHNAVSGRVSYVFGLHGPSIAIDTACSSSLVAIHLACQSLRLKESDMAIAGGVNSILLPSPFTCFSNWGMMASDGRCKTFDEAADGFIRSEGCGIVVLKRLSDALAGNDNILGLIRASAVNQDGRSSGLTVPNGPAQEKTVRRALHCAKARPTDISYVEAHGTGTSIGDPIEGQALSTVLCEGRSDDNPLVIGSVKTNLGHLEAAAGIAGLLKTVVAMQHEAIPANLHFNKINPNIGWTGVPVIVPTSLRPWVKNGRTRLAGVSSFGVSGTNAHVILEEAPEQAARGNDLERPAHLLTLSARSEASLNEVVGRYQHHLSNCTDPIGDVCFTANAGRTHFAHRLCVSASSLSEMREKLNEPNCCAQVRGRMG